MIEITRDLVNKCIHNNVLSVRENQVLNLLINGYNNITIAEKLYIQPRTVEHHMASIVSKFNIPYEMNARSYIISTTLRLLFEREKLNNLESSIKEERGT